jgi:hypothetical protein
MAIDKAGRAAVCVAWLLRLPPGQPSDDGA